MNIANNKYINIKLEFEKNINIETSIKSSKYMRNLFEFYGVSCSKRRSIYQPIIKEDFKNNIIDWEFLDLCYSDKHREFQYLVCDYLAKFNSKLIFEDIDKIKIYAKTKPWWDTIDCYDGIIGNIGLKDNRVDDLMLDWSIDEDFWLRRIAIDHQLNRKEKTNTELLSKIIINNLGSKEFFINKAIGWSLREYSKTNPVWVKEFLDKYKNDLSKLSIREASKYI